MASPGDYHSASPVIMDEADILDDLNFDNPYPISLPSADSPINSKLFSSDIRSLPSNRRGMSPPDSDPESSAGSTSPSNSRLGNRQSPSGTPPQSVVVESELVTLGALDDTGLDWNNQQFVFGQGNQQQMMDSNMMGDDIFNFSAFPDSPTTNTGLSQQNTMYSSQPTSLKRSRPTEASLAMASAASGNGFFNGPNVMNGSMPAMQWIPEQNVGYQVSPVSQFPLSLLPMGGVGAPLSHQPQQPPSQNGPVKAHKSRRSQSQTESQRSTTISPILPGAKYPYALKIHPAPNKSRVETQLNIVISLDRLPENVTKLHLPAHCVSKPKLMSKPPHKPNPACLELYCMVVCSSVVRNHDILAKVLARAASSSHPEMRDPNVALAETDENHPKNGGEVHICTGCIQRERKRAARKKIKNAEEDEQWTSNESRRIVVFNTFETIDWTKGEEPEFQGRWQASVPMRIACYCRHHGEKEGFRVIMTLKDHAGKIMAQTMTENIMITDDHKTHPAEIPEPTAKNVARTQARPRPQRPRQITTNRKSTTGNYASSKQKGRRDSGDSPMAEIIADDSDEPSTKRRKSSGESPAVPVGVTMMSMDTPQPAAILPPNMPMTGVMNNGVSASQMSAMHTHRSSVSPFTPTVPLPFHPDSMASPVHGLSMHGLSVQSPLNDQSLFTPENQTTAMDRLVMNQFGSTPSSVGQSRDPSPGILQTPRPSVTNTHGMMTVPPVVPTGPPVPVIQKVVPGEGSKCGGSEVTVLGVNFRPGMRVMFGGRESTTTNYWGENTLLCRAPPSSTAGTVQVTVAPESGSQVILPSSRATFKYLDDDGEQLIRMALTILNHKMNGKMEDPDSVARRVFNSAGSGLENSDNGGSRHGGHGGVSYNRAALDNVEGMVMKCLENIDLCATMHVPQFDLINSAGQTMLHIAASQGYNRIVAGLLARGANPNLEDSSGYTALHLAALNDNVEIVRRLLINRADALIESHAGYRAIDMSTNEEVLDILSPDSQLRRSLSYQSVRRASTADSIDSLPRMLLGEAEFDGGISPEYSTYEDDEYESDYDSSNMGDSPEHMVRSSTPVREVVDGDDSVAPVSPGVAANLAAHFQQFQQTMTDHLPSAAQLRNFSLITGIPTLPFPVVPQMGLPETQAFKRMFNMIYGPRDATPAAHPGSAPPAYDEIFPGSDTKGAKSSAEATARLEALRDAKVNEATEEAKVDSEVETEEKTADNDEVVSVIESEAPSDDVLTIGPKNAITVAQQNSFLRAYHAKNTGLGADRNLWLVWIPLLVLMTFAMFAMTYPAVAAAIWLGVLDFVGVPEDNVARQLGFETLPVGNMLALTKLSDVLGTAVQAATSQATVDAVAEVVEAVV